MNSSFYGYISLIITLIAMRSVFATSQEKDEQDVISVSHKPISAGVFEILPPDAIVCIGSALGVLPLQEAQNLAIISNGFYEKVMSLWWFLWTPHMSSLP